MEMMLQQQQQQQQQQAAHGGLPESIEFALRPPPQRTGGGPPGGPGAAVPRSQQQPPPGAAPAPTIAEGAPPPTPQPPRAPGGGGIVDPAATEQRQTPLARNTEPRQAAPAAARLEDEDGESFDSGDEDASSQSSSSSGLSPSPWGQRSHHPSLPPLHERPGVTWSNMTSCVPVAASAVLTSLRRGTLMPRKDLVDGVVASLLSRRYEKYHDLYDDEDDEEEDDGDDGGEQQQRGEDAAEEAEAKSKASLGSRSDSRRSAKSGQATQWSARWSEDSEPLQPDRCERPGGIDFNDDDDNPDLFDPTHFNTVLTGMGGTGKTVTAAMVVSRSDVLGKFCDGIAWIKLGQRQLAPELGADASSSPLPLYKEYYSLLGSLCKQLDLNPPDFEEPSFHPGDSERTKAEQILRLMENARQDMINNLYEMTALIVLDDLWHVGDVRWFTFLNTPMSTLRMLVTTRMHGLASDSGTALCALRKNLIGVGELTKEEAVRLLLHEAELGLPSPAAASEGGSMDDLDDATVALYAQTMVCACHRIPLAVRSAGRLLANASCCPSVGENTGGGSGERVDIGRLALTMANAQLCGGSRRNPIAGTEGEEEDSGGLDAAVAHCAALYESMDKSFSEDMHGAGRLGGTLKLCFVVFAAVFVQAECPRPHVPLAAAQLLWDGLLTEEERASIRPSREETMSSCVMKQLESLGLVQSEIGRREIGRRVEGCPPVRLYKVYHECMVQYAKYCLERNELFTKAEMDRRLLLSGNGLPRGRQKSSKKGVSNMVRSLSFRVGKRSQKDESALMRLNTFLVQQYTQKWENMSSQYRQNKQKMAGDGYLCQYLPDHMLKASDRKTVKKTLALLQDPYFIRCRMMAMGFRRGAEMHASNIKNTIRVASSDGMREEGSLVGDAVISICSTVRSVLREECPSEESCHKRLFDCCRAMGDIGHAYAEMGTIMERLERRLEAADLFAEALDAYWTAGLSCKHSAVVRALRHAHALTMPRLVLVPKGSDDCVILKNASALLGSRAKSGLYVEDGVRLDLVSHPELAIVSVPEYKGASFEAFGLAVGPKESALKMISSKGMLVTPQGDAVLASTSSKSHNVGNHVVLSHRSAGNTRSDFIVTKEGAISPVGHPEIVVGLGHPALILVARESPNRAILSHAKEFQHGLGRESEIPLELSSHPGCGIVIASGAPLNSGSLCDRWLGVGPAQNSVRASYNGQITCSCRDGAALQLVHSKNVPGALISLGSKSKKSVARGGCEFVINDDGSISPKQAPNLALGCTALSKVKQHFMEQKKATRS